MLAAPTVSAPPPSQSILSSGEEGVTQARTSSCLTFLPSWCLSCSLRHPMPRWGSDPRLQGRKGEERRGRRSPGKPLLSTGPQFTPLGTEGRNTGGWASVWLSGLGLLVGFQGSLGLHMALSSPSVSAVPAASLDSTPHAQVVLVSGPVSQAALDPGLCSVPSSPPPPLL